MASQSSGIIFDNAYNTYFAGGVVGGKIVLVLDKPKKIKGILLHIKGTATVRWTEQHTRHVNGRSQTHTITYYGNEEYLEMKYYCIGGREYDTITLPAGTHVYSFSCPLAPTLPSSLEGPYGNIRYTVKYVIERPWKWNQATKTAFTVISPYDLNRFPNLLSPAKIIEEKFFCCCCCKSGPLSAVISIPKTGYVSGERIPIIIEVNNLSNNSISSVTIKFQQLTTFYSQYPTRDVRKDVKVFQKIKLGMVRVKESKSWDQMLVIPPLPPSSLGYCSIIESEYQLYLEVSVGAFHMNLKATQPITIGTVPNVMQNHQAVDVAPPPDYDTAMGITTDPGWVGISNPTLSPVQTFGENEAFGVKSIQDDDDGEHMKYGNDSKGYTPFYPTYNFNYNG